MTRPANKHTSLQTRVIVGSLSLSVTTMTPIWLAWPQNLACQHRLGAPWRQVGLPSRHLGAPWCHLGASLAHYGNILTPYWALLVAILKKILLEPSGIYFKIGLLDHIWSLLGAIFVNLDAILVYVDAILSSCAPSRYHVGAISAHIGAILALPRSGKR